MKLQWQVITDKKGLVDFKELVRKSIPKLENRSDHTWDEKRTQWAVDLKKILPKLQQAKKIDATKHEEALSELKEKEQEVERLETALAKAQEQNAQLEELKDKEAVKALKRKTSGAKALQKEFDELIEAADNAKPKASKAVLKHIIADHFDRAGRIDWFNDRQDFEDAVKYGLISPEGDRVQWERDKLQPFKKTIQAVQSFLDGEDGEKVRQLQDSDIPMDPDDLEFWEYHLEI